MPSLQFSRPDGSETLPQFSLEPLASQLSSLGLTPPLTSLFPEVGTHEDWQSDDVITLCQNLLSITASMNQPRAPQGGQLSLQEVIYTKEDAIEMLKHSPCEHFTRDGVSFIRGMLPDTSQEQAISLEEQVRHETTQQILPALQALILMLEDARNRGFSTLEVFPDMA